MPNDWGDEAANDWGDRPEAPPASPAPREPRSGAVESALRGGLQGLSLKFGDELSAVLEALTPQAVNRALGQEDIAGDGTFRERYERARDWLRARNANAEASNPKTYLAGEVAGSALPLVTPAAVAAMPVRGASLGARVAQGAAVGGALGAVTGAGNASTLADVPGEAFRGGGVGLVGGAALPAAGAAVSEGLAGLRSKAAEMALAQGRKALTGNAGTISVKKLLSPEAVDAAYEVGAIRPGASVKGISERLGVAREAVGDEYGQIVRALEASGVEGPKASRLALWLSDEARQMVQTANPVPGMFRDLASEVAAEPVAQATGRLPLSVAEMIKRNLQNAARSEYVKEGSTSLAGEGKMVLASRLRQAVEDAIGAQASRAPAEAASFVPVKQRLGALIEADTAASTAAARAARRSNIGLIPAIAASGGLASGGPAAAAAAGAAAKVATTRGPATIGWAANRFAKSSVVKTVEGLLSANPQALGPHAQQLSALANRPGGLAAAHYVLAQTSPEYRLRLAELGVDGDEETQRQAQEGVIGVPGAAAAPPSGP